MRVAHVEGARGVPTRARAFGCNPEQHEQEREQEREQGQQWGGRGRRIILAGKEGSKAGEGCGVGCVDGAGRCGHRVGSKCDGDWDE